jgi:cytochrome c553
MKLVGFMFAVSLTAARLACADEVIAKEDNTIQRAVHVCAACHGQDGQNARAGFPNLAGQQPLYTIAQLKDFRSQLRAESDVQAYMWGVSALLDDALIEGLARYYSEVTPAPGRTMASKADISAGQRIFQEGLPSRGIRACAGCHGANADGASVFPRLAGQHADYILRQLSLFRTRLRPHGILMKNETANMSPVEMRQVAEYVESL